MRVTLMIWDSGEVEPFGSVKTLCAKYKSLKRYKLDYKLSKNKPYKGKNFRIERKEVIK